VFAQQSETSKATIAMLRVNPPLPEPKPAVTTTAFAPIEPAPSASPETETTAAPVPETAAPIEAVKPEVSAAIKQDDSTDTLPAQAAAPAEAMPAQAPADTVSFKVAATEAAVPATSEAAPAATSDTAAPAKAEAAMAEASETLAPAPPQATDSDLIARKLASIGDTTAKTDEPDATKAADAKAEQRARLRAERARARRRLAVQRARLARQQAAPIMPQFPLQPPTTDPFGQQLQPATTPMPRIRHAMQTAQ
jgi:hypothetical protein